MVNYVMAAETTLPNYKVLIMFIAGIGFQFGEVIFAIEAYFLRLLYIKANSNLMSNRLFCLSFSRGRCFEDDLS